METGSCSRRCMPSLRSKATQRRRKNVQGSGHGEWALSAAWRQKHRAAHAGRARTVATGSLRAWLLHGGSESRTGRGASHNARASIAPAGSGRFDGVTGSWADLRPGTLSAHLRTGRKPTVRFTMVGGVLPGAEIIELSGFVLQRLSQQWSFYEQCGNGGSQDATMQAVTTC